mgnify:CR=1 FL=1
MNQLAKDVLRKAWLDGTPQIKGRLFDGQGGMCAWGVLGAALGYTTGITFYASLGMIRRTYSLSSARYVPCPFCAKTCDEGSLLVHLNNEHDLDFGKIAELMPITEESAA